MDRLQWFFLEQVTQADMNAADDKRELADRNIVSDILGRGFLITGPNPATVVQAGTPSLNVQANQFVGYDQKGQRLYNGRSGYQGGTNKGVVPQAVDMSTDENAASTAVTLSGQEKTVSIFVKFARNPQNQQTDGNSGTVFFNQDESIEYHVVQSAQAPTGTSVPPPLRTDQLLLADVVLTFNQTTILNGSISQGRRQGFQLVLPHGASHVSTGSDPIPAATESVGGLLSAADKTKLDGVTFTSAGIAALFPTQATAYQPANLGPATFGTTTDVTSKMTGQAAGGAPNKEGIVTNTSTDAFGNEAVLFDTTGKAFLDATGNRVYGRLTVDNETTPTAWTLHFYSEIAGTETAYDFTAAGSITIVWFVRKCYTLDHLPTFSKLEIPSDLVAGTIPLATTSLAGKVVLAPDGGTSANTVVQGNDSRLASIGAGNLPVGSVVAWMAPTVGSPMPGPPSGFEFCDGGNVLAGASILAGRPKPNLMKTGTGGSAQKILRGHDGSAGSYGGGTAFVTGGGDTHSHSVSSHNHGGSVSFSFTTSSDGSHSHSISSDGAHTHNNGSGGGNIYTSPGVFTDSQGSHSHGGNTGSNGAHTHTASGSGSVNNDSPGTSSSSNIPAFVAMAMIIRVL